MNKHLIIFAFIFSSHAIADSQCGGYRIHWASDGMARINGATPETQKITFLKNKEDYNNIKIEWTVATDYPGRWVGMEFIGRDGKAILNAQLLQASMDTPRQYATFDCVKVK